VSDKTKKLPETNFLGIFIKEIIPKHDSNPIFLCILFLQIWIISMDLNLCCRICGLEQKDPPWGKDKKTPNFEICGCCGTEFGYEDVSPVSAKNHRRKWIESGAIWFNPKKKPKEWNLRKQLRNVPLEYRD
jgi:hypothetical protein